jgi:hypothetical protein
MHAGSEVPHNNRMQRTAPASWSAAADPGVGPTIKGDAL